MSYKEKRTIASILTGIAVLTAYCIYAFHNYPSGDISNGDIKHWAGKILMFIGIGIVANIVILIVFHILLSITLAVKEKIKNVSCDDKTIEKAISGEMVEDEMDRLIGLKSMRVSFSVAGFGFVLGLVALLRDYSAVDMLNIVFISFQAGSLAEGFTQIFYYRRGVNHA